MQQVKHVPLVVDDTHVQRRVAVTVLGIAVGAVGHQEAYALFLM